MPAFALSTLPSSHHCLNKTGAGATERMIELVESAIRFLPTSRSMSLTPRLAARLSCSLARRLNVLPWVLGGYWKGIGGRGNNGGIGGIEGMEGINVARGVCRDIWLATDWTG